MTMNSNIFLKNIYFLTITPSTPIKDDVYLIMKHWFPLVHVYKENKFNKQGAKRYQ